MCILNQFELAIFEAFSALPWPSSVFRSIAINDESLILYTHAQVCLVSVILLEVRVYYFLCGVRVLGTDSVVSVCRAGGVAALHSVLSSSLLWLSRPLRFPSSKDGRCRRPGVSGRLLSLEATWVVEQGPAGPALTREVSGSCPEGAAAAVVSAGRAGQ